MMTKTVTSKDENNEAASSWRRHHGRRLVVLSRYDRRFRSILAACAFLSLMLLLAGRAALPPALRRGGGGGEGGKVALECGVLACVQGLLSKTGVSSAWKWWLHAIRGESDQAQSFGGDGCYSYGCPIFPSDAAAMIGGLRRPSSASASMTTTKTKTGTVPLRTVMWCGATQMGNQHWHNQDRAVVISPFLYGQPPPRRRRDDNANADADVAKDSFFIGIFDGHGDLGHYVAEHALFDLPRRISDKLRALTKRGDGDGDGDARGDPLTNDAPSSHEPDPSDVERILIESFIECDADAPGRAAMDGGTTASIVMRLGPASGLIYTANVGDSLSFLAVACDAKDDGGDNNSNNNNNNNGGRYASRIIKKTERHKPHIEAERNRIESMGGKVHVPPPPKNPALARAVVYNSIKRELVGLAMSRSIGDWEHGAAGVIAEPTVEVVDAKELGRKGCIDNGQGVGGGKEEKNKGGGSLFAVSVSDGITDIRRPEFVANKIGTYLFSSSAVPNGANVKDGCMDVIKVATPKREALYRDDMTVVAIQVG